VVAEPPSNGAGGGASVEGRHLAIGAILATGAQMVPLATFAVMSVTIARLFGPTGTGEFSLVLTLFDVVLLVFTLGLGTGVTYVVSRGGWPLALAFRQTFIAAVVLGAGGALCGLLFYAVTRGNVMEGVSSELVVIMLASLPFALAWAYASAIALGRDRYEAFAIFPILQAVVVLLAGVPLALTVGLTGAAIGFAAAHIVTALLAVLWAARELRTDAGARPAAVPHGGQLAQAARFGAKAWTANVLQFVNYRVDLFILSAFASRADVGVYSVALSVTALAWVLPSALQTVLFPRTASLNAAVERGALTATAGDAAVVRAVRHSVILTAPTIVAMGLILVVAIPLLYGSAFHETVGLGFLLLPGVAALGVGKVVSAVYTGRGHPEYAVWTVVIDMPITIGLYLLLIPELGATGAALSSTLSYAIATALGLLFFRRATEIDLGTLKPAWSDLRDYADAARHIRERLRRRIASNH
jgi:O-antigen/teichoic acid export membrane protein